MSGDLASAPVPPIGAGEHVRGEGPEAILYLDLACPHCATVWAAVRQLPLRLCVRHFPLSRRRPRSPALHAAAEAVARLGGEEAFWPFWDSLYGDRGRVDDPHLWWRADDLGLELAQFDELRRSPEIAARVRGDFESGIRAGVTGTPAAFAGGGPLRGEPIAALRRLGGG